MPLRVNSLLPHEKGERRRLTGCNPFGLRSGQACPTKKGGRPAGQGASAARGAEGELLPYYRSNEGMRALISGWIGLFWSGEYGIWPADGIFALGPVVRDAPRVEIRALAAA